MAFLINPGSGGIAVGEAWENTEEQARINVYKWFYKPLLDEGYKDTEIINLHLQDVDGRWQFKLRHNITKVEIPIECHGITDLEAYTKENIFGARVYYNGDSGSNPKLTDFKADGFTPVLTYQPTAIKKIGGSDE